MSEEKNFENNEIEFDEEKIIGCLVKENEQLKGQIVMLHMREFQCRMDGISEGYCQGLFYGLVLGTILSLVCVRYCYILKAGV